MAQKIEFYETKIVRALKEKGTYNKALDMQIMCLAGLLRTQELVNEEIDKLESVIITEISRYGNESLAPHPVFKILKDTQDGITRNMKALGLTVEDLVGADDNDPLVELTKKVKNSGRKRPTIVKRTDPTT